MSTTTAEYAFAAEFATMAVAAAGVALVALRSRGSARGVRRVVVAAGLLALAAAAFVAGAQLSGAPPAWLGAVRIAGAAAVLAGAAAPWTARAAGAASARALFGSAVLFAAAGAAELAGVGEVALDSVLVAGAAALAVALVGISRRSVSASVAAGSAGTLVVVVLALSVALASVTASSLQRDELSRLAGRAGLEASGVSQQVATAVRTARLAGVDLAGVFASATPDPLVSAAGGSDPAAAAAIGDRLAALQAVYPVGGYAYVLPEGAVLAGTPGAASGALAAAAALASGCGGAGRGGALATPGGLVVAASFPECAAGSGRLLGRVVTLTPVGDPYLAGRRSADPSASLALVTPVSVLAVAGPQPTTAVLRALAATPAAAARSDGGRVVATEPVPVVAGPPVTVVASSLPTALDAARQRLLRTLFVVALGGTVLALALVALVGDRITAGIRALTAAARRVQAGDTSTRAGVASANEVGILGGTFDAMVVAIEEQNVALQRAADDEGRLRDRLQAIVAGMGDALVAVDAGGRVTETNPAAAELAGLDPSTAAGRPLVEVVDLSSEDGVPLAPRLLRLGAGRWRGTGSLRAPGGPVPVEVAAASLSGPAGEPAGAVVVLRDLRPERQVERMKTEFLSRVGHELRTPLTVVLGYAELLVQRGEQVGATRAAGWHGEILASARRLVRVVEMLEFFASSGAGRTPMAPEPVEVRALLADVATPWAERGGHIARRVARGTPAVMADRRWLAVALDELLDNAVKFSPPGGRVEVLAAADGDGRSVAILVRDRGKGMTEDERARAFAEFDQGDTSDTRAYGGLGLGLALVRQVVTEQGGTVECESAAGRGSTFTIRLPAAAS